MSEPKDSTIALNVRLRPSDSSAHPSAANYSTVGVSQGTAYLDFGFIEPALLSAVAKTAKDGQAASKGLDGHVGLMREEKWQEVGDLLRRGVVPV